VVHGPPDQVAMTARYVGGEVERIDDERCRVAMSADSASWLALVVAELALRFEVELDGPPEVVAQLSTLTERLASITARPGRVGDSARSGPRRPGHGLGG
jgi:hypothetical protein